MMKKVKCVLVAGLILIFSACLFNSVGTIKLNKCADDSIVKVTGWPDDPFKHKVAGWPDDPFKHKMVGWPDDPFKYITYQSKSINL